MTAHMRFATDHPTPAGVAVVDRLVRCLPIVLVLGALAMLVGLIASPVDDPDVWWHLRLGDDLWQQKSLTAPTDWSPRETVDWVPSEPLPEIVAARMASWWGLPSLAWLFGVTTIVVLLAIYWSCRRTSSSLSAAVATMVALIAMLGSLSPRPQMVSFVLLVLVPIAWARAGTTFRPPYWLIPLTWFWSMCHGFWVLGVGLSGVCWLGLVLDRRPARVEAFRLAVVPAASFLVVLFNPAGWDVVLAPLSVNDTARYIAEWQRTELLSVRGLGCAAVLSLVAVLMLRRRDVAWSDWLLLLVGAFMCWYSLRTIAVAALIVAPVLARYLDDLRSEQAEPLSLRRETVALAIGGLVGSIVLAAMVPHTSDEPGGVPSAMASRLDALPDGTSVLNAYRWGGWLAWRHPGLDRTSDGLVVPYDPDYIGDLVRIEGAVGDWQPLLPGLDVEYALLKADTEVVDGLRGLGWNVVHEASGAVLLSRPDIEFPG